MVGARAREVGMRPRRSTRPPLPGRRRWPALRASGFTVVELLIVVCIVSTLAVAAIPVLSTAFEVLKVNAVARGLAADLRYAQAQAVRSGIQHRVELSTSSQSYEVRIWDGSAWQLCAHPVTKKAWTTVLSQDSRYGGVALTSASFGTNSFVAFDKYGAPDNGGAVTLELGQTGRTVRVAPLSGRVTVE